MTKRIYLRFLILLAGFLFLAGLRAQAQGFGLSVTSSASSILISNSVTYTIFVTNSTAALDPLDIEVTNIMPASTRNYSAQSSQGTVTNYDNALVFTLGGVAYGPLGAAEMVVTVQLGDAGFATNTVLVSSFTITNTASTNVVVEVTNLPPTLADLGVGITSSSQPVITNDLTSYELYVTNFGPATATGISLTNTLPAGVILKGASHSYSLAGSNMVFNLGSLPYGSRTNVQISIQPTNMAVLPLIASIGASGTTDTNTVNNAATNQLEVISYLPGTLLAVTNSGQSLNLQNGLTEQSILLSNNGTNDVAAARVVVSGLSKRLFNASGTNGSTPFVVYDSSLAAGKSVSLLLQFYPRGDFDFTNGQLQAYAVPRPDWSPPAAASVSSKVNISRIIPMANGDVLIEFPAVSNRTYTVVYSDNVLFSNAMIAPPAITAPANRVQWIDYGPPTTASAPTNAATRFYRIFQNP